MDANKLKDIANILRRDVLKMTAKAGSGHPTSCLSCAEIMSVLFFDKMRYSEPKNENNDEFVLSKGHAAPILYASYYRAGATKGDLMTLRQFGSRFEGHPMPAFEWVKVATGSLGQGLSVGVGMALAGKRQRKNFRTYVLMGDSEVAEGSIYEALELASHYKLDNLCGIVDVNRLGQSGKTMLGHQLSVYKKRFEAFGCYTIIVNGHNVEQLLRAFDKAKNNKGKPTIILARTFKGRGVSFLENKEGWHGRVLREEEQLQQALKELPDPIMPKVSIKKPTDSTYLPKKLNKQIATNYKLSEMVATREAYGHALVKLDKLDYSLVALDGEVRNSTYAEELMKDKPQMYIESYIAEQNMIGMATGLAVKGFDTFASTFAAFITRAHDQLRMAALSKVNMTIVGSHAGVSIGQDGPSQMGLDDIAMFRSLPYSSIFYPSDAVSAEKLVRLATQFEGLTYIRTTRAKTPVIYDNKEEFPLGEFKVVKSSSSDKCVIVGAGITLHNALKAYEELKKEGINTAVVDCYCVKPFNFEKFLAFVRKSGNKVIVAEDHYLEGGIGEKISAGLGNTDVKFELLAIKDIPRSGKPEELMKYYGIDAEAIIQRVRRFLNH